MGGIYKKGSFSVGTKLIYLSASLLAGFVYKASAAKSQNAYKKGSAIERDQGAGILSRAFFYTFDWPGLTLLGNVHGSAQTT